MNEIFLVLGIEAWKPLVSTILLPPVPFLVLMLAGARLMFRRRLLAWLLVLLSVVGIWLTCTPAVGDLLTRGLLHPPAALSEVQITELKRAPRTTIVVLGAGRHLLAPEYGISTLAPLSIERVRYGLWLSRETGLPVGYSGGVGHGARPGISEGEIAARIAEREFGRPLRWTETESRDTRENALKTVALLAPLGYDRLVIVTHDFHMRRALRNFERATEGRNLTLIAAPMGVSAGGPLRFGDWLPSTGGYVSTALALHEWLGWLAGA
jgi:uncharacterized SAM-binding protein YcdF (DUF218 family)